jgi:hypothetical protein
MDFFLEKIAEKIKKEKQQKKLNQNPVYLQ